jgi:transposase-like protein
MPVTLLSTLIHPTTLKPHPPSDGRKRFFESTSEMPYEMPLVTNNSDTLDLICPFCSRPNHLVKWVIPQGKGFAQPNFSYRCEYCKKVYTKSNMGVRRFAEEVFRKRAGEDIYISYVTIIQIAESTS